MGKMILILKMLGMSCLIVLVAIALVILVKCLVELVRALFIGK